MRLIAGKIFLIGFLSCDTFCWFKHIVTKHNLTSSHFCKGWIKCWWSEFYRDRSYCQWESLALLYLSTRKMVIQNFYSYCLLSAMSSNAPAVSDNNTIGLVIFHQSMVSLNLQDRAFLFIYYSEYKLTFGSLCMWLYRMLAQTEGLRIYFILLRISVLNIDCWIHQICSVLYDQEKWYTNL